MHNTKCVYGVNMCETFYEREAISLPLARCRYLGNSSEREFAMLRQCWIDACFSLAFIACPALLAGDATQDIPNRDGLKQAWLQAMYAMEPNSSAGFTAQNAAQNLKLSFGSSGTRLVHGDDAITLRVLGYGRSGKLQQPEAAALSSSRNRVEYRRGALTEWYVNEARGLEQGFTLSAQPASSATGPLEIALEMTGLHPEAALAARSCPARFDRSSRTALWRSDGLGRPGTKAGFAAPSRRQPGSTGRRRQSRRYPVTIDPTVTQIMLVPNDGAGSASLGQSVAIDGNTAVVGAPSEGGLTGAAYSFVLSNGIWTQQAKLTASDGASGDQFGTSVSLDGQTAVIGAPGNSGQGAAYVFDSLVPPGPNRPSSLLPTAQAAINSASPSQ